MPPLLLDTHAVLWWLTDNPRLSARVRDAIGDHATAVYASAASGYEVAYKQSLGKLPHDLPDLPAALVQQGIVALPVTLPHMIAAGRLPKPHRDPWDRIIMAQALVEGFTVVTVDPVFAEYEVPVLW